MLMITLIMALAAGSILVEEEHAPLDSARANVWKEPWDNNIHAKGITNIKQRKKAGAERVIGAVPLAYEVSCYTCLLMFYSLLTRIS